MGSMTERVTYVTGKWVPESQASIHIYDSQFMFGDGVFEMVRTFNHKYFLLEEHIDRLFMSMRYLQIPIDKTKQEVIDLCNEAFQKNKDHFKCGSLEMFEKYNIPPKEEIMGFKTEECRLMINVSRGPLGIYKEVFELQDGEDWNKPTWVINVWPLSKTAKTLAHFYDTGVNAVITSQRQIPSRLLENKVKNRSRVHYQMANMEASKFGKDAQALLLDEDGFITEGTGANFLMIKNGKIIVPELRNMLRGSSMMYIINTIAPQLKIKVIEKNFEPYDILEADEAMFTGTFFNILPCNRLNGQFLNDNVKLSPMGPITTKILDQWSKNVGVEVNTQVKFWGLK